MWAKRIILELTPPKSLPAELKQGMFGLLGFLKMLFEIPEDFSKEKLFLSRPLNPLVIFTRKPLDDTIMALSVLI